MSISGAVKMFGWVILGFVFGSLVEWIAHRYFLHNFSKRLFSNSHFSVHHKKCRKHSNFDDDYLNFPPSSLGGGGGEIVLLVSLIVAFTPTILISFWLWAGLLGHSCLYYFLHRKSHIDVEWGKKWMPWHWDHHMGRDQNCNWGVTNPTFDYVFRTRKTYSNRR